MMGLASWVAGALHCDFGNSPRPGRVPELSAEGAGTLSAEQRRAWVNIRLPPCLLADLPASDG